MKQSKLYKEKKLNLLNLLDLSFDQLSQRYNEFEGWRSTNSLYHAYVHGIYMYLCADTSNLSKIISQLEHMQLEDLPKGEHCTCNKSELRSVVLLLKTRLTLRLKDKKSTQLLATQLQTAEISDYLLGEKHFVLGRANEFLQNQKEAKTQYHLASLTFEKQGLMNKFLKSSLNKIICEENETQNIKLDEYQKLLIFAIKQRDRSSIGILLNNIAFKIMFVGAFESAHRLLLKSLRFLKMEPMSLNYQLSELNLNHLYLLLNRMSEAKSLSQRLINSSFSEIRSAAQLLLQKNIDPNQLSEGWRWRLDRQLKTMEELTEQEDQLLGYMALKSRTKENVIRFIWKTEFTESTDIRFKRIISRIRSKRPQLIKLNQKCYELDFVHFHERQYLQMNPINSLLNQTNSKIVESKLNGDEKILIEQLKERQLSPSQLIENIYGEFNNSADEYWMYLNRLRQLIARVRRKFPSQLRFRSGCYYWV